MDLNSYFNSIAQFYTEADLYLSWGAYECDWQDAAPYAHIGDMYERGPDWR